MTRRGIASGLLLLGACVAACSLLTNPEQGEIRCKVSDEPPRLDPCPADMYCINKTCKPEPKCDRDDAGNVTKAEDCKDKVDNDCDDLVDERNDEVAELCDGDDNDCDGLTDEGFDTDQDDWTICGTSKFEPGTYDCDPSDKSVNPDAPEICDGQDNDCDGDTDNAPPGKELCDSPLLCLRGACTKPTCAVPEAKKPCGAGEECIEEMCVTRNCQPPCKANEFCQQQPVPICMPIPKRVSGDPCTTDADCEASLLCMGREALRLAPASTRGICGKACCKDSDCTGPDETCFVSGSGTRACLPRKVAYNTAVAGGTKPPLCSLSEDCAAGQACAPAAVGSSAGPTLTTTACRTPGANERKYATECGSSNPSAGSSTCVSRMCVAGNYFQTLCTTPCRSSKDCTALRDAARVLSIMPEPPAYCQYAELSSFNPLLGRNYAPVCFVSRGETGTKAAGAECRENRDCTDAVCIGASSEGMGRCAPVCCSDTQCSQIRADLRCRPVVRGTGRYEMRCLQ
jgi:hypothetical protein